PLREGGQLLGVGLVVGVDLDGQLARGAAAGRGDPQVGPALVDDPLAVAGDAGPADAVVGVVSERDRLAGGERAGRAGRQLLRDDVGRAAGDLADVAEPPA